jgi:N-acetylmuramoyl-L-alanine amidase
MVTGKDVLALAVTHVGEKYVLGARAPKDNAQWKGPWDCAEFTSWLVYQVSGRLYGCTDNGDDPDEADAFTGAWRRDARILGDIVSVADAAATAGAFVLRAARDKRIGHIVVSDGSGGTVEAAGANRGVVAGSLQGRIWDTGILVPWIDYVRATTATAPITSPPILRQEARGECVRKLQLALASAGFDPGPIDGIFGRQTTAAVHAFQIANGLVPDGVVGPQTLAELNLQL